MSELILQLILFFSFAVIVYLMAIAVPRIKDDELTQGKTGSILPLERMDAFLNSWKEKLLRRLRIYLMKAERGVTSQLDKSREAYQRERQKRPFPSIRSIRRKKLPEKSPEEAPEEQS